MDLYQHIILQRIHPLLLVSCLLPYLLDCLQLNLQVSQVVNHHYLHRIYHLASQVFYRHIFLHIFHLISRVRFLLHYHRHNHQTRPLVIPRSSLVKCHLHILHMFLLIHHQDYPAIYPLWLGDSIMTKTQHFR